MCVDKNGKTHRRKQRAGWKFANFVIRSPSSYLKHVEGLYWTMQALECQFTYWLRRRPPVEGRTHCAIDQNLAVARLRAKTGRKIHHGSDRAVVRTALETNRAQCRISICDAHSKTEFVPFASPLARQFRQTTSHRDRHLDSTRARIGTGNRIAENDHDSVAHESLQRAFKLVDEGAYRCMVLPHHGHHVLGLGD